MRGYDSTWLDLFRKDDSERERECCVVRNRILFASLENLFQSELASGQVPVSEP
jgi:hypothetical protein